MEVSRIIRQLDQAFEGLPKAPSGCISVMHVKTVYIHDPIDGAKAGILILLDPNDLPMEKLFTVRNRNETDFAIWAFDGCMDFREHEDALLEKACEAVVFNERMIAWVELKLEATAFSIPSANRLVSKACKQLLASVTRVFDRLDQSKLPAPWLIYQAYIGTPTKFPRRPGSKSEFAIKLSEMGIDLQQINVLHLQ
jgi:hypothetical protein